MADDRKAQNADRDKDSLDALHARLDLLEKKVDKLNEDLRGVAAFFFLLAVMIAAKLAMWIAILAAMALTVAYVAGVDFRTIRRSKRKRNKAR